MSLDAVIVIVDAALEQYRRSDSGDAFAQARTAFPATLRSLTQNGYRLALVSSLESRTLEPLFLECFGMAIDCFTTVVAGNPFSLSGNCLDPIDLALHTMAVTPDFAASLTTSPHEQRQATLRGILKAVTVEQTASAPEALLA
ncbi:MULTISPECIES: hypothetical protein [Caballeronia]|uniref:hypothetical protein n=1 Tax=Caballeronia TaxID=1827195 RepID=UPI001FD560AE|nr:MULTISPECIES: hypothetical protein [Caballeronia]MDR5799110.1 hypothetical protein [Caballeronia sp. LZ001]